MDFTFTPEQEAFRDEVRAFLDENLPNPAPENDPEFIRGWNAKVASKHWVGFHWPREEGGGGGTLIEQFILKAGDGGATRAAPRLGFHGHHLGRAGADRPTEPMPRRNASCPTCSSAGRPGVPATRNPMSAATSPPWPVGRNSRATNT